MFGFFNKEKFSPQELRDLYISIKIHSEELKILAGIINKDLDEKRYQSLVDLTEKMKQMYEQSLKDSGIDPRMLEDSCRGIQSLEMFDEDEEGAIN